MDIRSITGKKRDGKEISKDEFNFLVDSIMNGKVDESELSSFLMAVTLIGLSEEEAFYFALALANSGAVLSDEDKKGFGNFVISKQSIGGVSDIASLVVIPALASMGFRVMKMGRKGEGRTISTIDRLSTFKGFEPQISSKTFFKNINEVGVGLAVLPKNIVPAENILFQIRKKTGSYPSVPLLAVSVLARNIAIGTKFLLFDVKCGEGSFVESIGTAEDISKFLISICKRAGIEAVSVVSNLDEPLGGAIGKEVEVQEAVKLLNSDEKLIKSDLFSICKEMCATVCQLTKKTTSKQEAYDLFDSVVFSKKALAKFKEIVKVYGGEFASVVSNKATNFTSTLVKSETDGFLHNIDSKALSNAVCSLENALSKEETDRTVGIEIFVHEGEKIKEGQLLACLISSLANPAFSAAIKTVRDGFVISKNKIELRSLIFKVIC